MNEVFLRLDVLRKERKMSLKEMGEVCGISQQGVQTWKHGKSIPIAHLATLAAYFGVTVDWLLNRPDSPGFRAASDAYAQPDTPPASRLLTRDPPPPTECRYPTDCNLPARLENMEHDLADVRAQLHTLCGLLGGVLAKGLDDHHTKRKAG